MDPLKKGILCQYIRTLQGVHIWKLSKFQQHLQHSYYDAVALTQNGATNHKDVDWQASLRQSGTFHSTCTPPKEAADGARGLRSLDLSHNQFTDDLADELCPVLYEDAPLTGRELTTYRINSWIFPAMPNSCLCFPHDDFLEPQQYGM